MRYNKHFYFQKTEIIEKHKETSNKMLKLIENHPNNILNIFVYVKCLFPLFSICGMKLFFIQRVRLTYYYYIIIINM